MKKVLKLDANQFSLVNAMNFNDIRLIFIGSAAE